MEFKASNYLDFKQPAATDYANQIKQAEPKDNKAFENELSKTKERMTEKTSENNDKPKSEMVERKTSKRKEPVKPEQKEAAKETEKATPTENTEQKKPIEDEIKTKAEDINKMIVHMIVQNTGLTKEQIDSILEQMNITPMELMDQANMAQFVKLAFNVEDAADLLTMQEVSEALTALKSIMEQFKEPIAELNTLVQNTQIVTETAPVLTEPQKEVVAPITATPVNEQTQANVFDEGVETLVLPKTPQTTDNAGANTNANANQNYNMPNKQAEITQQTVVNEIVVTDDGGEFTISTNIIEQNIARAIEGGKAFTVTQSRHIMNQVMDKIRVNIEPTLTEFRITIRPEALGELTFKIASENGTLVANFQVENQRVKELLDANMDSLRLTLREAGVNITELNVHVNRDANEQNMERYKMERQKSSKRINDILNGEGMLLEDELIEIESDRNMDILI